MHLELPQKDIYKYRNAHWGLKILEEKILYFNNPKDFPDYYDCNIDLIDFTPSSQDIKEKINLDNNLNRNQRREKVRYYLKNKKEFEEVYKNEFNKLFDETRVSCFSERPDIYKVWGKYADGFKGLCIKFNSRISLGPIFPANVKYYDNLPNFEFFKKKGNIIYNFLTCKSKPKYGFEEEVRLFHLNGENFIKFSPELINEIIIGEKVTNENLSSLEKILKQDCYSHVIQKIAKIGKNETVIIVNEH